MKDLIAGVLARAARLPKEDIFLEFPENEAYGDYSTNVALVCARKEGKNPRQLAEEIISKLYKDNKLAKLVDKIEVAGPGFINFWLAKPVLFREITKIIEEGENYGASDVGKGKTVVVDYSSPNIAKRFSIGHLRSTIIGQTLYNLYQTLGYSVIGDNHLGDWGTQFGKLLYMIEEEKPKDLSIDKLEELYVKFHKMAEEDPQIEEEGRKWFKKLEEGDEKARKLWQKCVDISMAEFKAIYDLLGVRIDFALGESFYESIMPEVIKDVKGVAKESKGALIIEIPGMEAPLMLVKSDGGTTYATRDLATIKYRMEKWHPEVIIYEVGAEQTLYFDQLFAAAKLIGYTGKSTVLIHTKHGMYLNAQGRKFKTREGDTVKLEEVLKGAIKKAKALGSKDNKTAEMVGIGAIKYFDLMHSVGGDITFDWEKLMNLEGNSGPYLQYTYARTRSVLAKADKDKQITSDIVINKEENLILRSLLRFPEVILMAASNFSPNSLCNYLFDLCQKFNNFYNKDRIIGGENEAFRLILTKATGQVIKNGLTLLGIEAPERM